MVWVFLVVDGSFFRFWIWGLFGWLALLFCFVVGVSLILGLGGVGFGFGGGLVCFLVGYVGF